MAIRRYMNAYRKDFPPRRFELSINYRETYATNGITIRYQWGAIFLHHHYLPQTRGRLPHIMIRIIHLWFLAWYFSDEDCTKLYFYRQKFENKIFLSNSRIVYYSVNEIFFGHPDINNGKMMSGSALIQGWPLI